MTEDPVHPLFRDKPPPEAKLWRYLSFAKFASLLDAGQLHFTRLDQFDDHFEGAWPRQDLDKWERAEGFYMPEFTERSRIYTAVSCWAESDHESAAMWRLYARGNDGVAIVTSFAKLDELVKSESEAQWPRCLAGVGRVRYLDHFNEGLMEKKGHGNAFLPFMLKNVSYAHEHEVRALVQLSLNCDIPPGGLDLPIRLTDFVDAIVINPFGQPWFDKTVRGVADRYGLADRIRSSVLSPINFYMKR
jgi:hypothetical protein